MKPIIRVEEYCDAFAIQMLNAETREVEQEFYINQEEPREAIMHAFQTLGFEAEYEVVS